MKTALGFAVAVACAAGSDAAVRAAAKVALLEQKVAAMEAKMGRIVPALEPVSDKKFFDGRGADYPSDERPVMKEPFRSPFPILQADREYDSDYVKDENNDKGYWSAQLKYDGLRVKVPLLKVRIARAQQKAKEEEEKAEASMAKESDAYKAADAAEAANKDAQIEEDEAEAAAYNLDAGVEDQKEVIAREIKELEECKRRLAATKKRLTDLVAADPVGAEVAKENARKARSREMREESRKSVAEVQADIDTTEKELEAAAEKLRKKRAEQAAQSGHLGRSEGAQAPCPKGCEKIRGSKSGAALPGTLVGLCVSIAVALRSAA